MSAISQIPHLASPEKLWRYSKYTGLPRAGREKMLRAIRQMRTPGETTRRVALAASVDRRSLPAPIASLDLLGYHIFGPILAAERQAATRELAEIYQSARSKAPSASKSKKTQFLITLQRNADFLTHPAVVNFVSAQPLVELAAAYFGEAGVLSSVSLWWSPANATVQSSQLFHFDEEDDRQLKFFLHVTDVGPDNGPFSLIPADKSASIASTARTKHGRFTDDVIAAHGADRELVRFEGGTGTFACVDTSRCLHYGSRGNLTDRVVLMFQYTKFSAPRGISPNWGPGILAYVERMSPIQRRAFQFR